MPGSEADAPTYLSYYAGASKLTASPMDSILRSRQLPCELIELTLMELYGN